MTSDQRHREHLAFLSEFYALCRKYRVRIAQPYPDVYELRDTDGGELEPYGLGDIQVPGWGERHKPGPAG